MSVLQMKMFYFLNKGQMILLLSELLDSVESKQVFLFCLIFYFFSIVAKWMEIWTAKEFNIRLHVYSVIKIKMNNTPFEQ